MSEELQDKGKDEVEVTQYIRPNGRTAQLFAPVGEEHTKMAEGMIFSAEVLPPGDKLALYARWQDQSEEEEIIEFASNGPGDNNPTAVLQRMIVKLYKKRNP